MKTKYFLIICILWILSPSLEAQYKLENFTDMNQINSLTEEGDHIWVSTSGGVFKRKKSDGSVVSVFNIQNSGISRNVVESMYIDFYGNYWFGTYWGGISRFNGSEWFTIEEVDGFRIYNCNVITEDIDGNIWFGINGGKVIKYDGQSWELIDLQGDWYVEAILSDDLGNIWFGIPGINGGCWKMDPDGNINAIVDPWNKLSDNGGAYDILKDVNGNIWIAYYGGAFKYNPYSNSWIDYGSSLPTNTYSISQDGDGNIWFGTASGAYKFDGSSFTQYISGESGDRINMVLDILCDAQGNVWLGSYNGLAKVDKNAPNPSSDGWTTRIEMNAVQSNYVEDIAFLSDGSARMYGQYSYLISYNEPFFNEYYANDGCAYGWIKHIVVDENDNTWFATVGYSDHILRVIKVDPNHNATCYPISDYITVQWTDSYVTDISFDNNDILWIATTGGLHWFRTTGVGYGHITTENSDLPENNITGVYATGEQKIWFTTNSSGIGTMDYFLNVTTYNTADGLPSNYCNDITIDKDGRLWFLSSSYLVKREEELFSYYSTPVYFTTLEADDHGNIWMGGSNGGGKFNGENMRTFTVDDGLIENYVNNITIDNDGNVWFASGYFGITKLTPQSPVADFEHQLTCLPASTVIKNTSTNIDGLSRYEWDINNDGSVEYTTKDFNHQFETQGFYDIKLTVYNDDLFSEIIYMINVLESPAITTNPTGNVNICTGESLKILSSIDNFNPKLNYSYSWNTGETGKGIYADTSGTYFLSVSNGICSTQSDDIIVNAASPYNESQICMVTVDSTTNKNLIIWERTENVGIESYNVYKLYGNNYVPIGNVPFDTRYSHYTDYLSNPDALAARYAITAMDTCGNESDFSPYHQTIHLGASAGAVPNTYVLDWTPYIDESGIFEPEWYYCWAGSKPDDLEMIYQISGSFTEWNENNPGDRVYYKIQARKPNACFVSLDDKKAGAGPFVHSLSNLDDTKSATGMESFNSSEIKLFPNPMQNWTKISLSRNIKLPALLEIYELNGNIIQSKEIYDPEFILEKDNLQSGFYILKLRTNRIYTGKLIVR